MMMRPFFRLFLGFLGIALLLPACSTPPEQPNILFILTDDHGWSQVGHYGHSFFKTPNIDRLASQGMTFLDAYSAAPVCSPTRASIMTGKFPARLHLTDYIAGDKEEKLSPPDWQKFLPLDEVTIAERLKEKGYTTGYFGKWHLSIEKKPPESLPYNPDKQGFDEYFITYKPVIGETDPERDAHNVAIITEKSLDFLDRNQDRPFFLFMGHNSIHRPPMEKQALISKYEAMPGSDRPENTPVIAAMLETLDSSVGTVLDRLDSLGLAEKTIVIFFSDNGGFEDDADQTPLRAGKGYLYEGGIRVPFLVRWPGTVQPGSSNETPVISNDFFPTILSMVGLHPRPDAVLDGVDLVPVLSGIGDIDRDALYWHYPHYSPQGGPPSGAVRAGNFKLIEWYERSVLGLEHPYSLFNLEEDLGENNDIAEAMPEKTAELAAMLAKWRESVGAQMPTVNPDYQEPAEE